jgi:glyoxylase-like metal-dependent hydrolase (beta-lactamase superfamily II)
VLADGDEVVVSTNRTLTTVDSPGHAKHHLALHDSDSGLLFAGDAVGVRLPDVGVLRPATPPPDFDLDQALTSLRRFAARRPTGIALAHFGLVPDPAAILDEAQETLTRWAEVAEAAWREDRDIAEALSERFGADLDGVGEAQRTKLETLNGIHSNAAGFRRWLEQGHHVHDHGHAPDGHGDHGRVGDRPVT